MIQVNDIIQVNIETLVAGGDGLGRVDGLAVFVPDTVPGDHITAKVVSVKKNYVHAHLKEVLQSSEHRVKPPCQYAGDCGGCQWQHIDYEEQLRAKKAIIEDCFTRIAGVDAPVKDVISNDQLTGYRCKVQYPVQQIDKTNTFIIGYYQKATHHIVDIEACPVQPSIIDVITRFIRTSVAQMGLKAYNTKNRKGMLRHIVFKYSETHQNLLVIFVINTRQTPEKLINLSRTLKDKFPQIAGVLVNYNIQNNSIILGAKTQLVDGISYIEEKLNDIRFKISADSFFQTHPKMALNIFMEVYNMLKLHVEQARLLDVYAGVGTFSLTLEQLASDVLAVEESPSAVRDFHDNIKSAGLDGKIRCIQGKAEIILKELYDNEERFDVILLDPPRKGCEKAVINYTASMADRYIVYVSCNPATLARDVKSLMAKGFQLEHTQPFDMFSFTHHIESVSILRKS